MDIAVVETGVGGTHDATNVFDFGGSVKVITDIGLDHTEVLDSDLASIAAHKAGIIHGGDEVIVASDQPTIVLDILESRARAVGATVTRAQVRTSLEPVLRNADLASVSTAILLGHSFDVRRAHDPQTIAAALPPGRFERIVLESSELVVDSAHNPQELRVLGATLSARTIVVIFALTSAPVEKLKACVEEVARFASEVILPNLEVQGASVKQFADPSILESLFMKRGGPSVRRASSLGAALAMVALPNADTDVVVTGSVYAVAAVYAILEMS